LKIDDLDEMVREIAAYMVVFGFLRCAMLRIAPVEMTINPLPLVAVNRHPERSLP
jgi:hypothetical protein